jgi:hypothetical protein
MSAIGSLFGGSNQVPVNQFQMPGMSNAATSALNTTNAMYGDLQGMWSQYGPILNQLLGVNTQGGQAGATAAQPLVQPGINLGNTGMAGAQGVAQGALGALPFIQQMFGQAFDPQGALYNRTAQQLQDQVRAGNAAAGVATTPWGAGVEGKAMSDFNIDWQNNLLGRMLSGLSGGIQGLGGIGNDIASALSGGTQALGTAISSAMAPFSTMSAADTLNLGALGQGVQTGAQAYQPSIGDLLQYLSVGNQANQIYNAGQIGGTSATTDRQKTGAGMLFGKNDPGLIGQGFGLAGLFL